MRARLHLVTTTARALAGAHRVAPLPIRLRRGSVHARLTRGAGRGHVHLRGAAASWQVSQLVPPCKVLQGLLFIQVYYP